MFDIFNMIKKDKSAARKVTRQTIIGDILDMDQSTAPYFMEIGMHCLAAPPPGARPWRKPVLCTAWTAMS